MKYSPYSQSLDDDLFPKKEPRQNAGLWKWLLVIGFGLFFVYRSTLPVVHLQSEPPPMFIDRNPNRSRRHAQPERRVARAYWEIAVQSIQWKYSRKKSLPANPPPEFRINAQLAKLSENVDSDRSFYWQQLRDIWQQPRTWHVSYGWNTDWVDRSLMALQQYASQSLEQFVQSVRFWRDELGKTSIS
jgi:hypothetical protein